MSFTNIKNWGLALLVIILLLFAALTHTESALYRKSADNIENIHHPLLHRLKNIGNLLNSAEINFEVYRRREIHVVDTNTALVKKLIEQVEQILLSDGYDASIHSSLARESRTIAVSWNRLKSLWNQNNDLSSDDLALWSDRLSVSLQEMNWLLADLRDGNMLDTTLLRINEAIVQISRIENELDAFLTQEPIFIDNVLEPLAGVAEKLREIDSQSLLLELDKSAQLHAHHLSNTAGSSHSHDEHTSVEIAPDAKKHHSTSASEHSHSTHAMHSSGDSSNAMPIHNDGEANTYHENELHSFVHTSAESTSPVNDTFSISHTNDDTIKLTMVLMRVLAQIGSAENTNSATYNASIELASKLFRLLEKQVQSIESQMNAVLNIQNQTLFRKLDNYQNIRNSFTLLGCLLALLISLFMSMRLNRHVALVTDGTKLLSEGKLDYRIPADSNDQLGEIANAFNLMADKLRARDEERDALMVEIDKSAKEASNASAAKGQFMASMSHEIRTPINGVLGTVDLLMREPLTRSQTHLTETIHRSGNTLLGIINDILDYSKIESGSMELEETPFKLAELIEDIGEISAPSAHNKQLEISHLINLDFKQQLVGDPLRINQILTNLVSNAIKFTHKGGVQVICESTTTTEHKAAITVTVKDTGIGINDEEQSRIFLEFSQASNTITRKYGGTGLGLSISRQLTEMMGGELLLDSSPGEGSSFTLKLELEFADVTTDRCDHASQLSSLKVGIVSDHEPTKKSISLQLKAIGIDPVHFSSSYDTLDYLTECKEPQTQQPIDILIIDRQLSDINGLDLLRQIIDEGEKLHSCEKIQLCFVNEPKYVLDELKNIDVNYTINKPIRQSELFNCLLEIKGLATSYTRGINQNNTEYNINAHVLLVEDHPTNQDIVTRMLRKIGCSTTLAENGLVALEKLKSNQFDLVLMDCDMPVMDGFIATENFRAYEEEQKLKSRTPIVALTANALQGDRQRCIEAGMDDYLTKPLMMDSLATVVSDWTETTKKESVNDKHDIKTAIEFVTGSTTDSHLHTELLDIEIVSQVMEMDTMDNNHFFQELLSDFRTNWDKDTSRLKTALEENDQENVRKIAHRLKSSSGTIGAARLSAIVSDIEMVARQNDLKACQSKAITLPALFDSTMGAFGTYLKRAA